MGRSLVEDDDAQMMKVSLGCSEMGLSSHLQASKTGNTRFFTSNTHSSVVLQVSVCVIIHLLLNVRAGMWGVTICHSDVMSHMRVCVFGRDCEGHLCCYWQSGFSSHMKMILVSSSSSPSSSVVSPAWGPWEHSLAPFCGSPGRFQHVLVWEQRLEFNWNFPASHCRQINKGRSPDSFCLCASVHIDLTLWCMVFSSVDCFCVIICTFKSESL